jgi:hypothetical protein
MQGKLLKDPTAISLTKNVDGFPGFNSSNTSFWPIQFTINEFPPWLRKKFVLLGAVWFGSGKPNLEVYYKKVGRL